MSSGNSQLAIAIGGAAGQGIATPGNILSRLFVRRGLHLNAYNAYQSIIRGGHIFLTLRVSDGELYCHGDRLDILLRNGRNGFVLVFVLLAFFLRLPS